MLRVLAASVLLVPTVARAAVGTRCGSWHALRQVLVAVGGRRSERIAVVDVLLVVGRHLVVLLGLGCCCFALARARAGLIIFIRVHGGARLARGRARLEAADAHKMRARYPLVPAL